MRTSTATLYGVVPASARFRPYPSSRYGLIGDRRLVVLAEAAQEGRVLLTRDFSTITRYAYEHVQTGQPMPGVFEVSCDLPIDRAIEEILLQTACSLTGVGRPGTISAIAVRASPTVLHRARRTSCWSRPSIAVSPCFLKNIYGFGIPRFLQIFQAKSSLISVYRGTAECLF